MLISSKGRYALRLMIYIAAFGGPHGKVSLREVADGEDISLKYLEQLVRPLMQAGLLRSVRGKGGGYALARPAEEIRAGDILRVAEGTTAPVACEGLDGACARALRLICLRSSLKMRSFMKRTRISFISACSSSSKKCRILP